MEPSNREALVSETISRVINNAPVSEILRVYSLAVQNELNTLTDEELLEAVQNAGYLDLVSKYSPQAES